MEHAGSTRLIFWSLTDGHSFLHSGFFGIVRPDFKLEVIANNIANAGTQGFKGSRVMFEDLMYQEREQPGTENVNGDIRPTGVFVGLGTKVSGTQLDFGKAAWSHRTHP